MDRNRKVILVCGILILAIASISAIRSMNVIFLPLMASSARENLPTPTFDPCKPAPYPVPTAVGCPTATPGYNPYPGPATVTPSVTVTVVPPKNSHIYLPIIQDISK